MEVGSYCCAMRLGLVLAMTTVLAVSACGGSDEAAPVSSASGSASASTAAAGVLEQERLTILDQPIQYPKKKPAEITSSILQLEPGQESGWRKNRVPTFTYVIEGSVDIEYDAGVTQTYDAGSTFIQAVDVWHNISNEGEATARILTVNMGAKGIKSTLER